MEEIKKAFNIKNYLVNGQRLKFHNDLLGYFATKEEMEKAINESGIVRLKTLDGSEQWGIPTKNCYDGKSGNFLGVDPKFENWKENHKKKVWGQEKAKQEDEEVLNSLIETL